MPFTKSELFRGGGEAGTLRGSHPKDNVIEKIAKAKQVRKDGEALRAGKTKVFNNRRRISL